MAEPATADIQRPPEPPSLAAIPSPSTQRPPKWALRLALASGDLIVLGVAAAAVTAARFGTLLGPVDFGGQVGSPWTPIVEILAAWMPFLALSGMYALDQSWGSGEFSRALRGITIGSGALLLARYAAHATMPPRAWAAGVWLAGSVALVTERLIVRAVQSRLHRQGRMLRRTLVVGTNSEAASVVHALLTRKVDGFMPVGCLASSLNDRLSFDYTEPVLPTLGNTRDLARVVLWYEIETVVVVSSAFDHEVLERIIAEVSQTNAELFLSSSLADVLTSRIRIREVAGIPLISLRGIELTPGNLMLKRAFDLLGASAIVIAGMPVWLAVAALIKITSKGPVFYRQERVGLQGRPFCMYKFRSMYRDADTRLDELREANRVNPGPIFKMRDDPRVTPIGRWMRRFSIDEFPQLLNVLRGEMSLIGPRPPIPAETAYYHDYQWRRLEVVPGMTGLWQVSGRSGLTFEEMVALDLFYIGNWQLALDLSILARTIPAVLGAKGAW